MSATILSGEKIAKKLLEDLKQRIFSQRLSLAVIQVGKHPVSLKYIDVKKRMCDDLGIGFTLYQLPEDVSVPYLEKQVTLVGKDSSTTGMIIQLPLPSHIPTQQILDLIPPHKDVDVLSSLSFGLFALGRLPILPPIVGAVSLILQRYKIRPRGKNVVLVGAGRLVGLPLTIWFLRQEATVTVLQKATKNLGDFTKAADILISGVGKPKLIKAHMVKKGAVVIDAGTSVEQGKMRGDVDFLRVAKKVRALTPVPGGVGPLTVACLFQNLVLLNSIKNHKNSSSGVFF